MNVTDFLAALKIVDPCRKLLERLGAFLCRREIAALRSDNALLKARADELDGELRELKRKGSLQQQRLVALHEKLVLREKFRRVSIGCGNAVYALRRAAASDGEPPRLVCPRCFERDNLSELLAVFSVDCVAIGVHQKRVHLRCVENGCAFRTTTTPEAFRKAFKLAD